MLRPGSPEAQQAKATRKYRGDATPDPGTGSNPQHGDKQCTATKEPYCIRQNPYIDR